MRVLFLISFFALYLTLAVQSQKTRPDGSVEILPLDKVKLDKLWNDYKKEHNKEYLNEEEEKLRRELFEKDLKAVNEHNQKFNDKLQSNSSDTLSLGSDSNSDQYTFSLGLNEGSDLTPIELVKKFLGVKIPMPTEIPAENLPKDNDFNLGADSRPLPVSVDWRLKPGVIGPIRNQRECGSCWSFSALSVLESQIKIRYNVTLDLSEQNLVDCVYKRDSCATGGFMHDAYNYIIRNGVTQEKFYPYNAIYGQCKHQGSANDSKMKSFKFINYNQINDEALKRAIAEIGPISVTVNTNIGQTGLNSKFLKYKSGIFNDLKDCGQQGGDHAVSVVGYGSENGQDYFIIRNQWGTSWGENGYMRIASNRRMCNVGAYAIYPILF